MAFTWVGLALLSAARPPSPPDVSRGSAFVTNMEGIQVLHLKGDPYSLGFYHGARLPTQTNLQEQTFDDLYGSLIENPLTREVTRLGLRFVLRKLPAAMTRPELLEARGLADGRDDTLSELGPLYYRGLSYPAHYDLYPPPTKTPAALSSSLVAVNGTRGRHHGSFLARNLDLAGATGFDGDRTLFVVKPTGRFGYVSLGWPGFLGVLSGINEHGLAVALNPAPAEGRIHHGIPSPLLGRRLLTQARSVEGAIGLLTRTPSMGHQIIGLSDATGQSAIVELSPTRIGIRRGDLLAAANHFETPALKDTAANRIQRSETTSGPRRQRLRTLLEGFPERVGPAELVSVMRDRGGDSGRLLPAGHRHSINSLNAIHSLVLDSHARAIWVNRGPHTSGEYTGFDVRALLAAETSSAINAASLHPIPSDPLLKLEPAVKRARNRLRAAGAALGSGQHEVARRHLDATAPLNDHPITLTLRGRLAEEQGDTEWAFEFYRQALVGPPERAAEAESLRAALERLNRTLKIGSR